MLLDQKRFCSFYGHEGYTCSLVCTFENCTIAQKWVCQECLRKLVHLHGQSNQDHLLNQKELQRLLEQKNTQQDVVQQCMNQLDSLTKQMKAFQEQRCDNGEMKSLIQKVKEDFLSLSNDQIGIVVKNQKIYSNQQLYQTIIDEAKGLEQLISQKNQKSKVKLIKSIFEFRNYFKFGIKYIRYAQISQNEQYLAICATKKLYVYSLKDKILLTKYQLNEDIYHCIFSQDSTIIYFGFTDGWLCYLELVNGYNVQTIQVGGVQIFTHMIEKSNYKLFASYDKNILIFDLKQMTREFVFQSAHDDQIAYLDYDQINQVIVSCSHDKSIKFHNLAGQNLINLQQAHDSKIMQIQLINNNNELLSLCINGNLRVWQILLEKNQAQLIGQTGLQNRIISFCSVLNDKFIIIQTINALQIYDAYLQFLKQVSYSEEDQFKGINQVIIKKYI